MKQGWQAMRLGEVLRLNYGKPLPNAARHPDGKYPVYGANGEKTRSDSCYVNRPSIIVGRKGSAGQVTLTEDGFWPLDVTYFVTFDEHRHDRRFLYYLLEVLDLKRLAKGVKPGINRNEVYSLPVRVPPLAEQQCIVALLEDAFEGIEAASAAAERNRLNARAIFDSHLASLLAQRNEGWVHNIQPLADLCELIVDCEHKTAPTQADGIISIRTPNIGKGQLLVEGAYRVSEETYSAWTRRAEPRPGDLILAREAPAGNVAVIPENLRVCLGQRTVLIRPKSSVFESRFLMWFLLGHESQTALLAHSRGATVEHVNMKDIRAFRLPAIPSLPMQRLLVDSIDSMSRHVDCLETQYTRKRDALEALTQSFLHHAFAGNL